MTTHIRRGFKLIGLSLALGLYLCWRFIKAAIRAEPIYE